MYIYRLYLKRSIIHSRCYLVSRSFASIIDFHSPLPSPTGTIIQTPIHFILTYLLETEPNYHSCMCIKDSERKEITK